MARRKRSQKQQLELQQQTETIARRTVERRRRENELRQQQQQQEMKEQHQQQQQNNQQSRQTQSHHYLGIVQPQRSKSGVKYIMEDDEMDAASSNSSIVEVVGVMDAVAADESENLDDGRKKRFVVLPNPTTKRRKLNDESKGERSNGKSDADVQKKTSDAIIRMEEEIFILEANMDTLFNRKKHVEAEIGSIIEKLGALKTRLKGNEQQKSVLVAALEQHEHLQLNLGATLAKIVERLNRVLAGSEDEERPEADDDLPTLENTEAETTPTIGAKEAASNVAETELPSDQQLSKETFDLSNVQEQQMEASTDSKYVTRSKSKKGHVTNLVPPSVHDFWRAKRDSLSLMTCLPCLSDAKMIRSVMDIRATEALMWDREATPNNGRYRLESLWNTCLDFCLMGHIRQPPQDTQDAAPPPPPPQPMIDPDVALCPRELLGSCRDRFCKLQHMRPPMSPPKPAKKGRAKASSKVIVLEPATIETSLADKSSAIDPNVALCPYELTGVCADSLCPYQHMNSRPEVPILPRELLPLPALKVPTKLGTVPKMEKRKKVQKDENSRQPDILDHNNTTSTSLTLASMPSIDPIVGNDDFVTIPAIADSDESEDESVAEEGLEDWHSKIRHASEASRDLWWRDIDETQESPPSVVPGVLRILYLISEFRLVGKLFVSVQFNGKQISNSFEAIKFVGCVVDCVRLAIHGGRFDIGLGLSSHGIHLIQAVMKRPDQPEVLPHHTATCLLETLAVIKDAVNAAFLYDAHQQNQLIAAFENAALLGILSALVQSFYDHLTKPELAARNAEHHASFSCLLGQIREAMKVDNKVVDIDLSPGEGKKDILDRCRALFNPQPVSLPKQQVGAEDARDGDFLDVRLLLGTFTSSSSLYLHLAKSAVFALHRQEIFETFWKEAKMQLRSSGAGVLQAAIAVGSFIFGCIGSAVDGIQDKQNIDPSTVASLTSFDRTLYHVVSCLRDDYLKFFFGGILVAPLIAAATSLAVLLRNYPKAQHRIEEAVAADCRFGQTKLKILSLSELLLSQLTILRSSLPFNSVQTTSLEVKGLLSSLSDSHFVVARLVEFYEVHLNHVTLDGDWNLLPISAVKNTKLASAFILTGVAKTRDEQPTFRLIDVNPLQRRTTFNRQPCCLSAFPQGIFLAGRPVEKLELCRSAFDLPLSFGYHFPNLTTLNISGCGLQKLPESMSILTELQSLSLTKNKLSQIPEWIGNLTKLRTLILNHNELTTLPSTLERLVELTEFRATHNQMTTIPDGLLECKNLGVLHLSKNYLTSDVTPAFLMLHFPKLHDLLLQTQRKPNDLQFPKQAQEQQLSKKARKQQLRKQAQVEKVCIPPVSQGENFFNQMMTNPTASGNAISIASSDGALPKQSQEQQLPSHTQVEGVFLPPISQGESFFNQMMMNPTASDNALSIASDGTTSNLTKKGKQAKKRKNKGAKKKAEQLKKEVIDLTK